MLNPAGPPPPSHRSSNPPSTQRTLISSPSMRRIYIALLLASTAFAQSRLDKLAIGVERENPSEPSSVSKPPTTATSTRASGRHRRPPLRQRHRQLRRHQVTGKAAITQHLMQQAVPANRSRQRPTQHTPPQCSPSSTLGPDGKTAQGTWHELAMLGSNGTATWIGGIYENYLRPARRHLENRDHRLPRTIPRSPTPTPARKPRPSGTSPITSSRPRRPDDPSRAP